jgi:hypothetical protein
VSFRRWLPYGAIALAAHFAALVVALRGPVRAPAPTSPDANLTDLDVELTPPTEAPPAQPLLSAPLEEAPPPRAAVALAAHTTRETTAGPPQAVEPSTPSAPTAAPSDDGWSFDPRRPADLLAPGTVAQAVREPRPATAEATTEAPTGISKTGGLAEGLDAHDASIGMGRGGPVVSALEVAAASTEAPEGSATFDVAIDAGGHVSVALLSASAASAAWTKVGAALGASLVPERVRIPPGARGWHVVAMVEAKVQYPNGTDPKKLGTHVEASPDLALEENKRRATIEDPPIVFKKLPGVTIAHAGKVCSVAVSLGLSFASGISGGCDPSNLGANPLRVVRSHVVSEGRL